MAAEDPLALLDRALQQTGAIIARIQPHQAHLPTPCTAWDVRVLVNHTVHDLDLFASSLNGVERSAPDVDLIGTSWTDAYTAAANALLTAWRQRDMDSTLHLRIGDVPATWAVGQHLANMAVHGWDLARATGQSTDLDPEVGQAALDWARENLKPQFRGEAFGPEVSVPVDAPLYDRLAAFFGRDPT